MSSDIRALFDQVVQLPVDRRDAFLDAQVPDPALRARIVALLAADAARGSLLDSPLADLIGRSDAADWTGSLIGARLGSFLLVEPLGEGGSSVVFRAERSIGDGCQQVALKLLRTGLFTPEAQRRFRREQAILAQLSHPNIAHLIEGGITEAGIPFLAMEYVDGLPITRHAAVSRLDLDARLRLMLVVCRAVAAAHRALVVHRDLKPSNILVDVQGRVKLLDFGIAKLLDREPGQDADDTRTGQFALTPGYGAPEQSRGGPISTATDVYALGVLLHELLLGERPAPGQRRRPSSAGLLHAPVPPTALRGDLDTILLKAMAEDPEQRYAGAAELAQDIERHLEGRPVAAHPPSAWYRTRKFVRRHRGGVAFALVFLVAVLASLGIALWQAHVARSQALRAAEVQRFVEDMFQPLEQGQAAGQAPGLQELLERAVRRIDQRHPQDALVRAELLAMFARIRNAMGETASNLDLAEAAWRASAAAYGAEDPRTLQARSLHAGVLRKLGRYEEALDAYQAVREAMQARGLRGNDYARVLDGISIVRMEQGIPAEEAIALKLEVLREREADPASTPDDLASAYNNLGAAYQYAGDLEQALGWTQRAYELVVASRGEGRDAANVLVNIGMNLSFQGRWREAAAALTQARAMYASVPVERSPNLVSLLIRLCGVLGDLEDVDAALSVCDAAVAMAREVSGEAHLNHAMAHARHAAALVAAGRVGEADAQFDRARAIVRAGTSDQGHALGIIDGAQSRQWWLQEDYSRLRPALSALIDPGSAAGARVGTRSPASPAHVALLALACRRTADDSCPDDLAGQALSLLDEPRFRHSALRLPAAIALAEIELDDGQPERALARVQAELTHLDSEFGPVHSLRVKALQAIAEAHRQRGDDDSAARAQASVEAIAIALPPGHPLRR